MVPRVGTAAPWGPAVTAEEVEPDVWLVRSDRHGGYFLGLDALVRLPAPARMPGGWYEEDVAAMVPAVFLGWTDRIGAGGVTRRSLTATTPTPIASPYDILINGPRQVKGQEKQHAHTTSPSSKCALPSPACSPPS